MTAPAAEGGGRTIFGLDFNRQSDLASALGAIAEEAAAIGQPSAGKQSTLAGVLGAIAKGAKAFTDVRTAIAEDRGEREFEDLRNSPLFKSAKKKIQAGNAQTLTPQEIQIVQTVNPKILPPGLQETLLGPGGAAAAEEAPTEQVQAETARTVAETAQIAPAAEREERRLALTEDIGAANIKLLEAQADAVGRNLGLQQQELDLTKQQLTQGAARIRTDLLTTLGTPTTTAQINLMDRMYEAAIQGREFVPQAGDDETLKSMPNAQVITANARLLSAQARVAFVQVRQSLWTEVMRNQAIQRFGSLDAALKAVPDVMAAIAFMDNPAFTRLVASPVAPPEIQRQYVEHMNTLLEFFPGSRAEVNGWFSSLFGGFIGLPEPTPAVEFSPSDAQELNRLRAEARANNNTLTPEDAAKLEDLARREKATRGGTPQQ